MKTHRTDALSLTFGLIFLGAVVWWLFGRTLDVPLPRLGWLVAAALIVFGVLGLIGALRSDKREDKPEAQPEDQTPPDDRP